jgi:multisubunit Na+/H+ antiporter MnhB subunit
VKGVDEPVTLGRAFLFSLSATAGLAATAAFSGSSAVAVGSALAAGLSGLATLVFAVVYVLTAFSATDRPKAKHRRRVLGWAVVIGTLTLVGLIAYQALQALGNAV